MTNQQCRKIGLQKVYREFVSVLRGGKEQQPAAMELRTEKYEDSGERTMLLETEEVMSA